MGGGESDLGRFMEPVARALLGDPNPHLSRNGELRFGRNGSMAIDLEKGTAYSHEEETGGGVLWLIEREKKLSGAAAFEFLQEIGCDVDIEPPKRRRIVATYEYTDESGKLLFHVCRFDPKTFAQRAPDGSWKVRGIRQVPYRLPEIIEAIAEEKTIFIVEGEKDADRLAQWNIPATCNAGGAGKWRDEFALVFQNAEVVIIPDNDNAGRAHADQVAASLAEVARRTRILALPGVPHKGDISDWIAAGGTPEAFHALVEQAPIWTPRVASKFGGQRWSEIGAPGSPRYEWIVENLIPKGETVLIFGDSGTGKSFSTFDMGVHIALGKPFYGRNVEQGLVVYVAAEGAKGFSKRKIAYAVYHGLGDVDLPFYLLTRRPDFFSSDQDVDALIEEIERIKKLYNVPLVLIVLDTLSALTPGMNENASGDVSKVRQRLLKLVDAFGVSAAFVHHTAKGGTTPRGHGSLTADYETTIQFTTTEIKSADGLPVHKASASKEREAKKGEGWHFTLPVVEVGKNKWGNPETTCVPVAYDGVKQTHSYGFRANKGELAFMEALFDALNEKGVPPPAGLPASITRAVPLVDVRAKMRERYIQSDEDSSKADNRFRQAFKRAGDALKAGKVIGYRDPLIWYSGKPVHGLTATLTPVEVDA